METEQHPGWLAAGVVRQLKDDNALLRREVALLTGKIRRMEIELESAQNDRENLHAELYAKGKP